MNISLSEDQQNALEKINHWVKKFNQPYLTLGGYAGTGKTTLIASFRDQLHDSYPNLRVSFCAFTGKATRVIASVLKEEETLKKADRISTIHSLIYSALTDKTGTITGWRKKNELETDLIIVDEASMVDETIWQDLLSYGLPILAVGDHGQLPPINSRFNLMASPQLTLEKIHRQMEGHPIIALSQMARLSGYIPTEKYSDMVIKYSRADSFVKDTINDFLESYNPSTLVLCGYNKTRVGLNQAIRTKRDFETLQPETGDRVVCLRNNHTAGIYNGMMGTVLSKEKADDSWYLMEIEFDDEDRLYQGYVFSPQFGQNESLKEIPLNPDKKKGDLFDFGYAVTVHKAQGSQADKVIVFEERFAKSSDEDWRRWLYTAVTRAKDELYIIGD